MIRVQMWCYVVLLYGIASVSSQRDSCSLPLDMGQCVEPMTLYFYDKFARTCKPFAYGGVGGNLNRFDSFGDCMQTCQA
ncbi:hypothetical protein MTO96_015659 [Rhipicephalus appendiculatus]